MPLGGWDWGRPPALALPPARLDCDAPSSLPPCDQAKQQRRAKWPWEAGSIVNWRDRAAAVSDRCRGASGFTEQPLEPAWAGAAGPCCDCMGRSQSSPCSLQTHSQAWADFHVMSEGPAMDIEDLAASLPGDDPRAQRLLSAHVQRVAKAAGQDGAAQHADGDLTAAAADAAAAAATAANGSFVPGTQRIWVKTFGCSHNTSDAEYMMGCISEQGYK